MSVPGATHAERQQQRDHEQGRVFSSNNKETIQWGLDGLCWSSSQNGDLWIDFIGQPSAACRYPNFEEAE